MQGLFRTFAGPGMGIDFCSNDYLGLSQLQPEPQSLNPILGLGSGASRLISGNHALAEETEAWVAEHFGADSALWYGSGYLANLGLFSCLASRGDTYLYDEFIHASIRDGLRLSQAHAYSFRHNDLEALRQKASVARGRVFVVIESVYSMDGDTPPLEAIVKLCRDLGWYLIVDEAHSLGVFGNRGEGHTFSQGWDDVLLARVLTFGKAAGFHGAMVLGSPVLKEYLTQFSRPLIYTTASSRADFITLRFKLEKLLMAEEARLSLFRNVEQFIRGMTQTSLALMPSVSPIQSVLCDGNDAAVRLAELLSAEGFEVRAVRSPTVPKGTERIRIILHSFNTQEQVGALVSALSHHKALMKIS
jgi:8-amino-7-oxononanoate synthase